MQHKTNPEAERVAALRDAVIAYLEAHDAGCPKGAACQERLNLIGYLAHCAGLRSTPANLAGIGDMMRDYEATCPNCAHLRN